MFRTCLTRGTSSSVARRADSICVWFFVEKMANAFAIYKVCIVFISTLRTSVIRTTSSASGNRAKVVYIKGMFTLQESVRGGIGRNSLGLSLYASGGDCLALRGAMQEGQNDD